MSLIKVYREDEKILVDYLYAPDVSHTDELRDVALDKLFEHLNSLSKQVSITIEAIVIKIGEK